MKRRRSRQNTYLPLALVLALPLSFFLGIVALTYLLFLQILNNCFFIIFFEIPHLPFLDSSSSSSRGNSSRHSLFFSRNSSRHYLFFSTSPLFYCFSHLLSSHCLSNLFSLLLSPHFSRRSEQDSREWQPMRAWIWSTEMEFGLSWPEWSV